MPVEKKSLPSWKIEKAIADAKNYVYSVLPPNSRELKAIREYLEDNPKPSRISLLNLPEIAAKKLTISRNDRTKLEIA